MSIEYTLSILKPDAVAKNIIGKVLTRFEEAGLSIIAAKMLHLTKEQAQSFYDIHKASPFYSDLVRFMTSGPVLVQVLEGDNAVQKNRLLMGATNPKDATPGSIRKDFAESIDKNIVHGSDSLETAKTEIAFFFSDQDICLRAC